MWSMRGEMYGRFREIQGDMWRLGAHVEHEEEGRARQPHAQQLHERVQQACLGLGSGLGIGSGSGSGSGLRLGLGLGLALGPGCRPIPHLASASSHCSLKSGHATERWKSVRESVAA